MPLKLLLPRLIWVIMFVTILTGFSAVVLRVSRDYFEYRTVSHITIRDYPQDGTVKAPALEICVAFNPPNIAKDIRIGDFLSGNYFNDQNETWRVLKVFARISKSDQIRYQTKKYIMGSRYCLFVKVLNYFRMAEVAAPYERIQKRFFWIKISANPIHTNIDLFGNVSEKCDPRYVYISLVTDESTLSNPIKREGVRKVCSIGFSYYIIYLTYSSLVTVKLPSPYDSNCFDYRRDSSYLSTHDCYNQCLKDMTKKWNVVPDVILIDKERYKQSEHYFAHGYILEDQQGLKILKEANISKNLRDAYHALHHEWKRVKKSCRQSCSRPDCWFEDISPNIVQFTGMGSKDNENRMEALEYFFPFLTLSNQAIIEVSSIPKQNLLDYVIYILSNLSFWLGFCPLATADTIMKKLQECTRRKKTLEDKVRKYTKRFRSQEKRIRILEKILTAEKEKKEIGNSRYECDFEPWTQYGLSQ